MLLHTLLILTSIAVAYCQSIVLTNDDGWATAQIRAQDNALTAAGFNVSRKAVIVLAGNLTIVITGCLISSSGKRVRHRVGLCNTYSVD